MRDLTGSILCRQESDKKAVIRKVSQHGNFGHKINIELQGRRPTSHNISEGKGT
jgi:hypothetical protein